MYLHFMHVAVVSSVKKMRKRSLTALEETKTVFQKWFPLPRLNTMHIIYFPLIDEFLETILPKNRVRHDKIIQTD